MARRPIRVMISSRCADKFPEGGQPLSDLRKKLKAEIEAEQLFGEQIFEVWINEDAPPADTSQDSFEVCLQSVDEADVVLVLSNGNAGWAPGKSGIGICHAELARAYSSAPGKVRLISLGSRGAPEGDATQLARDAKFKTFLDSQQFFRGGSVKTVDDAATRVREALADAVRSLTHLGVREARKGKHHIGDALTWSKLDFSSRRLETTRVITDELMARGGASVSEFLVTTPLGDGLALFRVDAVPSSLGVAQARELVGRPFLNDWKLAKDMEGAAGPVHIIGCQKGATEVQAQNLLGFPDATIVTAPFGVYVADPVQKIQFVFLRDCRDPSSTRFAVQRFFDWLGQTGEDVAILERGRSRARIVMAIAEEI